MGTGRDLKQTLRKRPDLNSTMVDTGDQQQFHTEGFDSEVMISSGR
jgi:hypothetical protein